MPERLDIDRCVRRTSSLFLANAGTIVPTNILVYLPYFGVSWILGLAGGERAGERLPSDPDLVLLWMIGAILSVILSAVATAAVTWICACYVDGQPVGIRSAIATALGIGPAVLATTLLVGVVVVAGLFVFILPGLVLMAVFYVSVPALVVERRGIVDSMMRSRELTRGRRLKVFVGSVLYGLLIGIIAFVVAGVPALILHLLGAEALGGVLYWIASIVGNGLIVTFAFVVYDELSGFSAGRDETLPLEGEVT